MLLLIPLLPDLLVSSDPLGLGGPQVNRATSTSRDPQAWPRGPAFLPAAPRLPLCTGVGTKRLVSQAGSDPRKQVPGAEPAGARTILLHTPPAGQDGPFSLSLSWVSLPRGARCEWAGKAGVLTGVGARDEPEAAVLQRGILQCDPHAQHPAQGFRVQEGGILVGGDCHRPSWA